MIRVTGINPAHVATLSKPDLVQYVLGRVEQIQKVPEALQRTLALMKPYMPYDLMKKQLSESGHQEEASLTQKGSGTRRRRGKGRRKRKGRRR